MYRCIKLFVIIGAVLALFDEASCRRGGYGNRRPNPRFPPSRPTLANQVSAQATSGATNVGAGSNNNNAVAGSEGVNGQKRFVAQLVSGMLGGMAEQAVFMCPQMCENMLNQMNALNPTIVGIFQGFIRCPNACNILDSVVQVGLGVSDALVEGWYLRPASCSCYRCIPFFLSICDSSLLSTWSKVMKRYGKFRVKERKLTRFLSCRCGRGSSTKFQSKLPR